MALLVVALALLGVCVFGKQDVWLEDCVEGDCEDGIGAFRYPDGAIYDGEWKNGEKDGNGTFTLPSGDRFTGKWKANRQNGFGVYEWANGNRYEVGLTLYIQYSGNHIFLAVVIAGQVEEGCTARKRQIRLEGRRGKRQHVQRQLEGW